MKLLTKKQQESCKKAKVFIKKNLKIIMLKIKKIVKLGPLALYRRIKRCCT